MFGSLNSQERDETIRGRRLFNDCLHSDFFSVFQPHTEEPFPPARGQLFRPSIVWSDDKGDPNKVSSRVWGQECDTPQAGQLTHTHHPGYFERGMGRSLVRSSRQFMALRMMISAVASATIRIVAQGEPDSITKTQTYHNLAV